VVDENMSTIIPAILPTSYEDLEAKLRIAVGHSEFVQIDAVDGKFIPHASWPYLNADDRHTKLVLKGEEMLPFVGSIQFEMDLMVSDPEAVIGTWIEAGANRITIHAESVQKLPAFMEEMATMYGHAKGFAPNLFSLGIAIGLDTELSLIEPFVEKVDYVQFMAIARLGRQGEPFDPRVLRKIAVFKERHPSVTVQVDGGVSLDTAPQLLKAGVDRLIVGSAIWGAEDPVAQMQAFVALIEEHNQV
jgi:ribulose-phosphate 3-epimerase